VSRQDHTPATKELRLVSSTQSTTKMTTADVAVLMAAPSRTFAVVVEDQHASSKRLRMSRWNDVTGSFTLWDAPRVRDSIFSFSLAAASDQWVVLTIIQGSATAPTQQVLDGRVWNGSRWSNIASWNQRSDVRVRALTALPGSPSGNVLIAMGNSINTKGYGVWRLVP
jgi:hypothetical protein